jgi:peptidoglycan/LPS O-acetylase OafA/YrhL
MESTGNGGLDHNRGRSIAAIPVGVTMSAISVCLHPPQTTAARPMTPLTDAEKYPAIDVLRALAALAVVGCHCVALGKWEPTSLGTFGYWLQYGWLGVDLFFVISGFVITSTAIKLRGLPWREYASVFWLRRGARILPLYYLTLIAFLLLVDHRAVTGDNAVKQIATHVFLIHQWWPETAGSINGVTWTLGIEILFYLLAWWLVGVPFRLAGGRLPFCS